MLVKEEETFDKPECFGQVMAFCGRTLTQTFREWASEHHFEYGATRNEKQFYARLQSLNVPHERVSRGGRTYVHLCVCSCSCSGSNCFGDVHVR